MYSNTEINIKYLEHAHSFVGRVFMLQVRNSSIAKKNCLESQQGTSQGHPVRSDFQTVKEQVVFFVQKSPPLAVARHP